MTYQTFSANWPWNKSKHPVDEAARRHVEHEPAAIRKPHPTDVKHTPLEDDHGRFSDDGCPHHSE